VGKVHSRMRFNYGPGCAADGEGGAGIGEEKSATVHAKNKTECGASIDTGWMQGLQISASGNGDVGGAAL